MIILEIYKGILRNMNLTNLTYGEDLLLCGISFICLIIDAIILSIILMILIRVITKKPIRYWIKRYLKVEL